MELVAKNGQHIHTGHRFALQENSNVVAAYFHTGRLFYGDSVGLVGGFVQHGGEAEKLTVAGLIHQDLLMVLVDGSYLDGAGYHDVGVHARFAHLVNAPAGSERL
jgi:hypothetical protein